MLRVVFMGVSGSGKTVIGRALATELGAAFVDADDLHPPENIAWMEAGKPLNDEMRAPWLDACAQVLRDHHKIVLACSALKRKYRNRLRKAVPTLRLVYPNVSFHTVAARLADREGHFMPSSLLQSQFDTLQEPDHDENAIIIPNDMSIIGAAKRAAAALRD